MSLLLDALKKAEEAKRQSAAGNANAPAQPIPSAELALEPVHAPTAPPTPPGSPLPDLSAHIDNVNADLASASAAEPLRKPQPRPSPAPTAKTSASAEAERAAVRNVFTAKQTPPRSRQSLWLLLGGLGLAAIGIGGWFWWQMQSVGSGSLATAPTARPAPPPAMPAALPPLPVTQGPVATTPAPVAPLQEAAPVAEPVRETPTPPRQTTASAAAAEAEGPVRITRGQLRIPPALTQAYERLQADDSEGAAKAYRQVLRDDPKNLDALLGMAAVALRKGQAAQAEEWYIKALEADPKDVAAQAGLINLRGLSDPVAAESRLKNLLATQPDSPLLNFALGNIYAGQKRWAEAQLAYFNAYTADSTNPDYLFNLAASLDHLHLSALALEYYEAALAASASRKGSFDVLQVKARILELKS